MNEPVGLGPADGHHVGQQHPLLADPARLQRITRAMYVAIHRTLFRRAGLPDEERERALPGGESADDVLQDALVALLKYAHHPNWEALSMQIAHGCAVDALRRATKGRRRRDTPDDEPDQISVSPFDEAIDEHTSAPARAWWDNPELAYEQYELFAAFKPLIGALPEPVRTIVVEVVVNRRTRAEIGEQLGLTGARVGQILAQSLLTLHEQVRRDPNFSGHIVEREKP